MISGEDMKKLMREYPAQVLFGQGEYTCGQNDRVAARVRGVGFLFSRRLDEVNRLSKSRKKLGKGRINLVESGLNCARFGTVPLQHGFPNEGEELTLGNIAVRFQPGRSIKRAHPLNERIPSRKNAAPVGDRSENDRLLSVDGKDKYSAEY